jgi:hypothetical protein
VDAGQGHVRALTEVERALLACLLDAGGRVRWPLGQLAAELFGEGSRPGEVAGPLWQMRAAGLVEVAVVDAVDDDGPVVEVETRRGRVAPPLPGGVTCWSEGCLRAHNPKVGRRSRPVSR